MTIANLSDVLQKAKNENYAVAGLVVLGWEDARCYAETAEELNLPVILQAGPGCRANTPVPILGKMFRYLADQSNPHRTGSGRYPKPRACWLHRRR